MKPFGPEEKGAQPPPLFPAFKSSVTRAPATAPLTIPQTLTETTGPSGNGVWERLMGAETTDLTKQYSGAPLGERIMTPSMTA